MHDLRVTLLRIMKETLKLPCGNLTLYIPCIVTNYCPCDNQNPPILSVLSIIYLILMIEQKLPVAVIVCALISGS